MKRMLAILSALITGGEKLVHFTTNAISQTLGKKVLALVVITLIIIISVGSSSQFSIVVYA